MKKIFCFFLFVFITLAFLGPRIISRTMTKIDSIEPKIVYRNCEFIDDPVFTIGGHNLNNIVAVMVNGKWKKDCEFTEIDDGKVQIRLDKSDFDGESEIKIQFEKKFNTDLETTTNAVVVKVIEAENVNKPIIKHVEFENTFSLFENNCVEQIFVHGENFDSNSSICINDKILDTLIYKKDGKKILSARVPISFSWSQAPLKISILQTVGNFVTSYESETYSYKLKPNKNQKGFQTENEKRMWNYFNTLDNENNRVYIVAKDEASSGLTEQIIKKMQELGLDSIRLKENPYSSYIAVLDGGKLIDEEFSMDPISYIDVLPNGKNVEVNSANYNVGDIGSIIIDGIEYAVGDRGLNIVVVEKNDGTVLHSICFDTWDDLHATEQETVLPFKKCVNNM